MSDSRLIDRLASLDAYPEAAPLPAGWLDADLETTQQRSSVVTTLHEMKRVEPETPRRDWRPLAALAAVIVAIAAFLVSQDNSGDVAESVPTTTTVVFDRDAAALAKAAEITALLFTDDVEGLTKAIAGSLHPERPLAYQADGVQVNAEIAELEGCENLPGNRTVCMVHQADDVTRAFGIDSTAWEVSVTYRNATSVDVLQVVTGRPLGYAEPPAVQAFFEWAGTRLTDAEECVDADNDRLFDTPETCWPYLLDLVDEFTGSEAYDEFR